MEDISRILDDILFKNANKSIPEDLQGDLIEAARGGNDTALVNLLYSYSPLIRKTAATYSGNMETDDVKSAILEGFWEAIAKWDASKGSLAHFLPYELSGALAAEVSSKNSYYVPQRTLTRFFSILRIAEGSLDEALSLCPQYKMKVSTFLEIYGIVSDRAELDAALEIAVSDPVETDEDLVDICWQVVEDDEERACRLYYGFDDYEPLPDAEVGHRMGTNRTKAQRTRQSALGKMREALGVAA